MLGLILKENLFQFNGENYLQTHGTAMGTKMAVSFANFFMAEIETKLIQQNDIKPREWKRYIDDVFCHWDSDKKDVDRFIEQANKFHPTIISIFYIPKSFTSRGKLQRFVAPDRSSLNKFSLPGEPH